MICVLPHIKFKIIIYFFMWADQQQIILFYHL